MRNLPSAFSAHASVLGVDVDAKRSFLTFRDIAQEQPVGCRRSQSCPPPTEAAVDNGTLEKPKDDPTKAASETQRCDVESGSRPATSYDSPVTLPPAVPAWGALSTTMAQGVTVCPTQVTTGAYLAMVSTAATSSTPQIGVSAPSIGSLQHESGTCKTCVFFAYDCCFDGASCGHCHAPHSDLKWKRSRPPKFIREALRARGPKAQCPQRAGRRGRRS